MNITKNKSIVALVLAACSCSIAFADTVAVPSFAEKGTITICTDATFPPMEFFEKAGDTIPVGFDIDFIEALSEYWEVESEIVVMDFTGLLPSLEAGRCDAVISGMFVTPARTENFDAVPYLATSSVLIAQPGEVSIGSLQEASGKTIAVQQGTSFVEWFEAVNEELRAKGSPEINVQLYPRASDGIQQVLIGRAYATTTQDTEVAFRDLQNPGSMTVIYTFEDKQRFGVFLRREGDDQAKVAAAVTALRESGALGRIAEKWRLAIDQLEVEE